VPKRVDHEQRRQRIAAALLHVAASQGLEGVSLRHVAAQAGVTSGMVQHYFPSKDAMIAYAMRSASARYSERVEAALVAVGPEPDPGAVVRAVLGALLPRDDEQRRDARVALAFQSYAASHPAAAEGLAADNALLRSFVADQLQRRGGARPDPSSCERAATALLALTDGLGAHVVCAGLSVDVALAALEAQLDLVLGRLDEPSRGP
jgi:AcrR family transcriptional regulator